MSKVFALFGSISIEGMETVNKAFKDIHTACKKTENTIGKFGKNVEFLGKQLTLLTAPLLGAGIAAVKFGMDFNQAMTNSLSIMGDVSVAMRKDMEMAAREMAKNSTFSVSQIADAYYFLASAGLSVKQSIAALPLVTKFAQAGLMDLSAATDYLTSSQSALGIRSADATKNLESMSRIADVLADAGNRSQATIEQFSKALTNKAGSALKLLNKDIEEGVAILAVYADQGIKGEEGGEALSITLRDLQRAYLKNSDVFKNAGIEIYDTAGKMNKMADIIRDLENLFKGMSDEQKRSTLIMLGFQDRSVASTMALVGFSEKIREYEKFHRLAGGTIEEVSKKQLESFKSQLIIIKNRLIDVSLTLWEKLYPILKESVIPAIEKTVSVIAKLADMFSTLPNWVQKTIVIIVGLVAVLGPFLLVMGKIIFITKALTAAMFILDAAILANPLVVTIVAAVAAAVMLTMVIQGIIDRVNKLRHEAKKPIFESAERDAERLALIRSRMTAIHKENLENAKKSSTIEEAAASKKKLLTEEEKKQLKELAEERKKMAQEYSDKLFELQATEETSFERRKKAAIDHAKTIKATQSEIAIIEKTFAVEREQFETKKAEENNQRIKDELEAKKSLEQQWSDNLLQQSDNKIAILDAARERDLANTELTEKAKADIIKYYENEVDKAKAEGVEKDRLRIESSLLSYGTAFLGYVDQVTSGQKTIGEATKDMAISIISIIQKEVLARAIASIAIAWAQAGVTFGASLAQLGITAAKVIPSIAALETVKVGIRSLAGGGLAKSRNGGIDATIAEGGQDEFVLPMRTGIAVLANALIEKLSSIKFPTFQSSGNLAMAGAGSNYTTDNRANNFNLYVGTLVADDAGIKKLSKEISKFQLIENQRRGM